MVHGWHACGYVYVHLRVRMYLYLNTVPVCMFLCPSKSPRPETSSRKARQLSPGRRRHAPLDGINEARTTTQVNRDSISSGNVPALPATLVIRMGRAWQARGVRKRTSVVEGEWG